MSVVCSICDKVFTARKNLYKHMRNVHKTDVEITNKIICPVCQKSLFSYSKLREHISKEHHIEQEIQDLKFNSKGEFMLWKELEEKTERSSFVLTSTKTLKDGKKKSYFSCSRSGTYSSQSSGARVPKAYSTCKMGSHCPATMEVIESDEINVIYYKIHVGHEKDLKHLLLSKTDKEELSRKLALGIPFERILKDVRQSYGGHYERIHMLTHKDLQNISKTANLEDFKRHENDAVSIQLFVDEMSNLKEHSPVAFFKPQGVAYDNLDKDDFLLVIMTDIQKNMLIKFGSEKICIDSTHGTNQYNFLLTTIVIVDEFHCGFPVAFCFSNRTSGNQMEVFFKSIFSKIISIRPKIFMSDDAPAYYNSWRKVFGEAERQLLCAWHINKNWKQALSKVIGQEKKIAVYKYLRTLLETTDQHKFEILLENFLKECEEDDDARDFGTYFRNTYANRCKQWAYCHRLGSGINTNMHLEAFHKVLKHIYMRGTVNKRLDVCISHLLNFVKDKTFDRHTKLIKGATSAKSSDIHKSHRKASEVINNVQKVQDFEWLVESSSNKKITYKVQKKILESDHYCQIVCRICCMCIHSYTCTCSDSVIRTNICKHIHAVHMIQNSSATIQSKKESDVLDEIENSAVEELCVTHSTETSEDNSLKVKLSFVTSLLSTHEIKKDTHGKIHKNLDNIISLIYADNKEKTEDKNTEPPNKKIKLQPRFYSTKNKKSKKAHNSKPSTAYKLALIDYVTNSGSVADHTYSKNEIE